MISLCAETFDPYALLKEFTKNTGDAGAVASFIGLVRKEGAADVSALILEHHPQLTQQSIEQAVDGVMQRWDLLDVRVVHRIGRVETGEPIVLVATAAAHRRAAFESCDMLMDFLKTDAPFWKKELTASGENWIEPSAEDYQNRSRWD